MLQWSKNKPGLPGADLKEGSKEEEEQGTVSGQLIAPGFVAPLASAVPCEGSHAGPFCKGPGPGNDVAQRAWGQQVARLLALQQQQQLLVLMYSLQWEVVEQHY